jgi:hypothetical protein
MGANQVIDRLPYLPILAHLDRSCCNHVASLEIQPTNVGSGRLEAPADRRHRGWAASPTFRLHEHALLARLRAGVRSSGGIRPPLNSPRPPSPSQAYRPEGTRARIWGISWLVGSSSQESSSPPPEGHEKHNDGALSQQPEDDAFSLPFVVGCLEA